MNYDSSRNRYFNSAPNVQHATPSFGYVWASGMVGVDQNGRPTTGIWIPSSVDANGNLLVNAPQFDTITGQLSSLSQAVNALTGTVSSKWQKINSTGYVQQMTLSGHLLIQKVQGYSNYTGTENFIQIFDNTAQVGVPTANLISNGRNNFFYDYSQQGTEFFSGITVATSSDPILPQTGDASMFCTILYQQL
jgi:hypothetical protein